MPTTLTSAETSAAEVAAFLTDEPGPYFAYHAPATLSGLHRTEVMGDRITTWTGDDLARVIHKGEPYRSGFRDRRQNFRALGINGVTYAGTAYLSAGDYVRMRPVKA